MTSFRPFTLNLSGRLIKFEHPVVAGIINVTPDSFFDASRTTDADSIARRVERMVEEGADMLDVGAYSSRPGAGEVSADEEKRRLAAGMEQIRRIAPDMPVSVDTFRSDVAREAVRSLGCDMVNDISGGDLDEKMFETVAALGVPYILMHMRGTPSTMQSLTDYGERGVTATVLDDLGEKLNRLALSGVNDVIIDPGFGFGKTVEQNYRLMRDLEVFRQLGCPVLVGISRKSMIGRLLKIDASQSLNGTTALNVLALDRGASILRVHDVKEAREAVEIFCATTK